MKRNDQGATTAGGRYTVIPRTLSFVLNGEDVLLLKGAPNKRLWANLYNGVGGHVERDEDVCAAARREICEETGWGVEDVDELALRALVNIDAGHAQVGVMLFVFTATARKRQADASSEGTVEWIPLSRLLEYPVVEDLVDLLPRVLAVPQGAPPIFGHYSYDQHNRLVTHFYGCNLPDPA